MLAVIACGEGLRTSELVAELSPDLVIGGDEQYSLLEEYEHRIYIPLRASRFDGRRNVPATQRNVCMVGILACLQQCGYTVAVIGDDADMRAAAVIEGILCLP